MPIEIAPFEDWLKESVRPEIEKKLAQALPASDILPQRLHEAMRYACLGGGKRIRATMVLAAGLVCSKNEDIALNKSLLSAATAVELIHAYSLVHDDLPVMDDDKLRRGKPTVHVQYDDATALLVGDALQALAFEELTNMAMAPALIVKAIQVLARAAGSQGMVGGQALDLSYVDQQLDKDQLQQMQRLKTGALIEASVVLGAIVGGATYEQHVALESYAAAIGLAFQVVDDILDVTQNTAALGKTAGKDANENKPTYVSTMGLDNAKQFAAQLYDLAIQSLLPLGAAADRLRALAAYIINRNN